MQRLTFSSKLDWASYIILFAKTVSEKIGALICFMKFLSPEAVLYIYKSTLRPRMESCCHFWAVVPSCYLVMLNKLQNCLSRTEGPLLAGCLQPLLHRRILASFSQGVLLNILINCMNFLSLFLDILRMSMPTVSFLAQLKPWILCLHKHPLLSFDI